jgi:hypothetical protein
MAREQYIQFIPAARIDREKWDSCIRQSSNGLIYGYSFYLDAMADNWGGLVCNDYELVMPLPWRKKYGISYIYQPYFVAQLGVFGNGISGGLLKDFFAAIPKQFRYVDLPLNHKNIFPVEGLAIIQRSNYIISLDRQYEIIYAAYRDNIRRNIKRCMAYGCEIKTGIALKEIIALSRAHTVNEKIDDRSFTGFENLFDLLKSSDSAKTYGVLSKEGQLLASCVFFFSNSRAYYILVGNHPNGRTLGASHALIDAFIKDHAGKNILLDFEGSDMRNLAFFYSSFGAVEEPYASVRWNRLPFYLRWMKGG